MGTTNQREKRIETVFRILWRAGGAAGQRRNQHNLSSKHSQPEFLTMDREEPQELHTFPRLPLEPLNSLEPLNNFGLPQPSRLAPRQIGGKGWSILQRYGRKYTF